MSFTSSWLNYTNRTGGTKSGSPDMSFNLYCSIVQMTRSGRRSALTAWNEGLRVPQGEFELARYPTRANETLRAWDAADEFLLRHLAAGRSEAADVMSEILIINDNSGAL